MQFTANNIDINDSLLGGKDTFHAAQVPGWQRGPNKTKSFSKLEACWQNCPCNSWGTMQQLQAANIVEDKSVPVLNRTYWTEVVYCFYTFVWRQAYFPETSASEPKEDRLGSGLGASWRSTGPCLYDTQLKLGSFVGLVSFWCTTGCATLLGKCRRSHFVCTGQCGCTKVEANFCIKRCYNSLTLIKINISSIFLKRLKYFID